MGEVTLTQTNLEWDQFEDLCGSVANSNAIRISTGPPSRPRDTQHTNSNASLPATIPAATYHASLHSCSERDCDLNERTFCRTINAEMHNSENNNGQVKCRHGAGGPDAHHAHTLFQASSLAPKEKPTAVELRRGLRKDTENIRAS